MNERGTRLWHIMRTFLFLLKYYLLLLPDAVVGWSWKFHGTQIAPHGFRPPCRNDTPRQRFVSMTNADESDASPLLIILIPAYNEEERIQSTLESYQDYLIQSQWDCEILVVDDGSQDKTFGLVDSFPGKIPITCIKMTNNGGKGAAIAMGVQEILDSYSNAMILTQDADGSGNLKYLDAMMKMLKTLIIDHSDGTLEWKKQAMVTGNRNYNLFSKRGITRWGFQTAVRLIMNDDLGDTQCAYKLFTLSAASTLYKDLHLKGWSHDVEVLFMPNSGASLFAICLSNGRTRTDRK